MKDKYLEILFVITLFVLGVFGTLMNFGLFGEALQLAFNEAMIKFMRMPLG